MGKSLAEAVQEKMDAASKDLDRKRFGALRWIAGALVLHAAMILLFGFFNLAAAIYATIRVNHTGWELAAIITGGEFALLLASSFALFFKACAEAIQVVLAIEQNTRDSAEALARLTEPKT